jgi:serine/threonine protein kinase
MQCELFDAVPALVDAHLGSSKKTIPFAPLAMRLIDLVEAIHKSKNILLDVKPDNLMIDLNVHLSKKLTTEALAKSIRLVDLGLLKSFYGTDGNHVPNLPAGDVQGTPLYASIHVHDLQTPSRRDDLYAMLLVIADLLLHIHGKLNHKEPPYGTGKAASYLPWSQEPSDNAIGKIKATQLSNLKSPFFASMPSTAIAKSFFAALEQVHQTDFARPPNFDAVRKLLSTIQILFPETSKVAAAKYSKKRSAVDDVAVASPLRRSARNTTQDALPPRKKIMPPIEDVEMEDADIVMIDQDEENVKPPATSKRSGFLLIVTGGPNNNVQERIVLDNTTSTVTIGSSAQKASVILPDLSPVHVRLSFSKSIAVFVEPLGKSLVQVNRLNVGKTGMMAFVGQSISFGGYTVASVQSLVPVEDDDEDCMIIDSPDVEVSNARSTRVVKKTKVEGILPTAIKTTDNEAAPKKKPTMMLQIISPNALKGTQFQLEEGVTLVFGSDASTKKSTKLKEQYIRLEHPGVASRHTSLSLVIQQGTLMVQVRDLKSFASTYVNNLRVPSGKDQMAFYNGTIRIGEITMVVKK